MFFALGAVLVFGVAACSDSNTQTKAPVTTTTKGPSTGQRAEQTRAKPTPAARASNGPSDPRSSKTPSKRQFVARADRVCRRLNKQLFALGPGLLDADKVPRAQLPKAAAYIDRRLGIARRMQVGIAVLGRPKSGGPAYDALQSAFVNYVSDLRRAASGARAGDLREFRSAFHRIAPRGLPTGPAARQLSSAMRRFRFTACGEPPII